MEGGLADRIARITAMFFSVTTTCVVEVNEDIVNVSQCRLAGVPDKRELLLEVLGYITMLFAMFLVFALSVLAGIHVRVLWQRLHRCKDCHASGDEKLPQYAGKTCA